MEQSFREDFEGLIEKYAELLTGQSSKETVEKVKFWALFQQIHKTMPTLVNHWNHAHPEEKAEIRKLFEEIKQLNEAHRANSAKPPAGQ